MKRWNGANASILPGSGEASGGVRSFAGTSAVSDVELADTVAQRPPQAPLAEEDHQADAPQQAAWRTAGGCGRLREKVVRGEASVGRWKLSASPLPGISGAPPGPENRCD
jgi:hypothetical protein